MPKAMVPVGIILCMVQKRTLFLLYWLQMQWRAKKKKKATVLLFIISLLLTWLHDRSTKVSRTEDAFR